MKKCFLTTALLVGFIISAFAQTKTIQIRLNGIFMGECGNDNNCTHEPVAGEVQMDLATITPNDITALVPRTGQSQNPVIWENMNYQLVCTNLYAGAPPEQRDAVQQYGDRAVSADSGPGPIANNIWNTFYYQVSEQEWRSNKYRVRMKLRLGNKHQDNFMSAVGENWTDTEFPNLDFQSNGSRTRYSQMHIVGPFQTTSNRCHQYWLQFQIDVN